MAGALASFHALVTSLADWVLGLPALASGGAILAIGSRLGRGGQTETTLLLPLGLAVAAAADLVSYTGIFLPGMAVGLDADQYAYQNPLFWTHGGGWILSVAGAAGLSTRRGVWPLRLMQVGLSLMAATTLATTVAVIALSSLIEEPLLGFVWAVFIAMYSVGLLIAARYAGAAGAGSGSA